MSKYYIDCREVAWGDCAFMAEAETVEQVVEQLTDHARVHRNLRSFGPELYGKIRRHIRRRDDGAPVNMADAVVTR